MIGYGGAAGSGKSDLALDMAGTTRHRRSIIFRRVFPSLRSMIDRSRDIFNSPNSTALKDRFNESLHVWHLENGKTIEFGAVQYDDDKRKHQGQPRDFMVFDEAAEFLESQVRYLMAWNRSVDASIQPQTLLTFNPPSNAEGQWIIKFFGPWLDENHSNPAQPGELRYFYSSDGKEYEADGPGAIEIKGESIQPRSRTFFPARVTDNPYWEGTNYIAQLQALPEPLRSQLLYGDMKAGIADDAYQILPSEWVRAAMKRWTAIENPGQLTCIGVDPSRGGDDSTVISPRYGYYFGEQHVYPGAAIRTGQDVVIRMVPLLANGGTANVDVIGIGSSAVDIARMQGLPVNAVNFGEGTDEKDKGGILSFQNVRALAYWRMRESLDPNLPADEQCAIPDDPELFTELTAHRFEPGMRGIKVKSKDEVKERIGRSPDKADSLVLANLVSGYNMDVDALIAFYKGEQK